MNTKYVLLAIIIIVVIAGGWYYLAPGATPAPTADQPATGATTKTFSLVVKDRKLISPASGTLVVTQGDSVSITITANESDELHLHGYDLHTDFATDTPATITFTATQSGRFPFEMEGSKTDLGELDVEPK